MVNSRMFALYPLYFCLSYHFQFNTKYDYTVQNQPRKIFFDLIDFDFFKEWITPRQISLKWFDSITNFPFISRVILNSNVFRNWKLISNVFNNEKHECARISNLMILGVQDKFSSYRAGTIASGWDPESKN